MRIAVLGSGGIRGYYGALLAKGGHDVAYIARVLEQTEALAEDIRAFVTRLQPTEDNQGDIETWVSSTARSRS